MLQNLSYFSNKMCGIFYAFFCRLFLWYFVFSLNQCRLFSFLWLFFNSFCLFHLSSLFNICMSSQSVDFAFFSIKFQVVVFCHPLQLSFSHFCVDFYHLLAVVFFSIFLHRLLCLNINVVVFTNIFILFFLSSFPYRLMRLAPTPEIRRSFFCHLKKKTMYDVSVVAVNR